MASTLIGFGILFALLAAIFGYLDYSSVLMSPRARQRATTHMYINLGVTLLFLINYFLRSRNPEAPLGYLLSLVGVAGLAVSGWLGGVLVFEEARRRGRGPPRQPSQGDAPWSRDALTSGGLALRGDDPVAQHSDAVN